MEKNIREAVKASNWSHGITKRLIVYVVLFSSLLTLLITAFQLFQEYRDGVSGVKGQIAQIEKLSLTSVTENLWNLYDRQIQSQLEDLIQLPDLQYLEIRSAEGVVASTGSKVSENTITETLPLIYVREDENIHIGNLVVVATLDGVYQELFDRVVVILVSNGFKTALVSVFIFMIFQYLVTRHLTSLSHHLENLSADNLDARLVLDRRPARDELSQVVSAINELGASLGRTTISKNYLDNIVASMGDGLVVADPDTTIQLVNRRALELLGYEKDELVGRPVRHIFEAGENSVPGQWDLALGDQGGAETIVKRCLSKSGKRVPAIVSLSAIRDEDDEIQGVIYVIHDITERIRFEEELFAEKERAQVTLRSIGDAVISTDAAGRVNFLNPVAEALTGWSEAESKGKLLREVFRIVGEESRKPAVDPVARCLNEGRIVGLANHTVLLSRSGVEYAIEDSAAPIFAQNGNVLGVVLVFKDVTAARHLSQQVSYQATHDTLTGLINRSEFERRLRRVLETAQGESTQNALCYLDLDQFKLVNDTSGHVAGDELLRQLGQLLQQHIRKRDTLARLGGDEFGLLMEHCAIEEAQRVANKIVEAVGSFSFPWEEHTFSVGVSIGLVAVNDQSKSIQDLLSDSDTACYIAKEHGRNRVHLHQEDDEERVKRQGEMQWAVRLPRALSEGRFQLYFQKIIPVVSGDGDHGRHYELLLRMEDEQGHLISPGVFLPAAERYSISDRIDRWVIGRVLGWFRDHPAQLDALGICAINLSGLSLSNETFLPFVIQELKSSGVPPRKICFEITETVAIANLASATTLIKALRQLGCRFALDDFGSGLSSFAYLKSLPVDFLKIDGVFVKDILDDPMDLAMVRSINEIGHVTGKKTIAEFVENDAILMKLREIGVDYAQGYGIGKPSPFNELLESELLN